MRISVFASKDIQATIAALTGLDRELAKQIRAASKSVIEPVWKREVAERLSSRLESRVLGNTARVAISDQNVTLKSAAIGRSLTGGGKPSELFHNVEFGADRSHVTRGRHTRRQFRPRNRRGYVVYPAAANIIPRIASLWAATTIRTLHELLERK
jgi:hypothetical protein